MQIYPCKTLLITGDCFSLFILSTCLSCLILLDGITYKLTPLFCLILTSIALPGNNLYGDELKQVLEKIKDGSERTSYILMDKIKPLPTLNYLLRAHCPLKISECVSELGIFGVYIRWDTNILHSYLSAGCFFFLKKC